MIVTPPSFQRGSEFKKTANTKNNSGLLGHWHGVEAEQVLEPVRIQQLKSSLFMCINAVRVFPAVSEIIKSKTLTVAVYSDCKHTT